MSSLKRCPACQGTKRIRGMGMIERKCESCEGIGWIEENESDNKNGGTDEVSEVKVHKRRGRKPKEK